MSTGDDIPDRRERCECGEYDEEHFDACPECEHPWHEGICGYETQAYGPCPGGFGRRTQSLCPDGSGEFRRAVRPDRGDR